MKLKHIILLSTSLICFKANAQSDIDTIIKHLFSDVETKYGNVYFLNQFDAIPIERVENIEKINKETKLAVEFIKKNQMKYVPLDFESTKKMLPPNRVTNYATYDTIGRRFAKRNEFDKKKSEKVDAFIELYTNYNLDVKLGKDSLDKDREEVNELLRYSVFYDNRDQERLRLRKKLFKLMAAYQSDRFYLIVYRINFGYHEDEFYAELMLR